MVRMPVALVCLVFTISIGALAQFGAAPVQLAGDRREYLGTRESSAPREPMIAEQADGVLFTTGYADPEDNVQSAPRLWKSTDRGATWKAVNVGTEAEGAVGNSDVDLAIARDGTIYFVDMVFKNSEGVQISVGVSQDRGESWRWTLLSKNRFDDRPWVAVAPDGTAHVIWNDGSGVYRCASHDRGLTWARPERIHVNGGSSHLAVGPNGEIAVRIGPMSASGNKFDEGVDLIAVSTDGGTTWQDRKVPGKRDWAPMGTPGATPRWVEPIAWDDTGALYLLWTELNRVWLAQSRDQGSHWSTWKIAETDALAYYPYLTVNNRNELGATWFSGAGESLRWQACRIRFSRSDQPSATLSAMLRTEAWATPDPKLNLLVRDTAGEYLPALFLRDGTLAVVTPIRNPTAKRYGFSFWTFHPTK